MALTASATPSVASGTAATGGAEFVVTGYSTDASTPDEVKAAPGTGFHILIDAVILTSNDADAFPWLQDEDDNILFGRFFTTLGATGGPLVVTWRFKNPIKMVSNKALELKAAAAGNVSVYVEGRIKKG